VDALRAGWQSPRVAARDPRFRPYRIALWVAYFSAIILGVGLMVFSIARQLRGPATPPAAAGPPPTRAALRECLADLEVLFREQNERAWRLGTDFEAPDPFGSWSEWSVRWERRVRDFSDRCGLDADDPKAFGFAERTELAGARDAMLALHRAYTAQVNRFAAEHADLARGAAEALAHARETVKNGI
jgi:hypothetical protein